jgi:hypothetical protein
MGNMTDSKTAALQTFLRHSLEQPQATGLDPEGRDIKLATLTKTAPSVAVVALEVNGILNDLKLSDQGQQTKLMAVGPRVVPMFEHIGIVLSQADQAQARLEVVLFGAITKEPAGNEVVRYLRQAEIRRALGAASKSERNAKYLLAVEVNDFETAQALLNWPGGPMVSPDIQKRAREAFAQRTSPEALAKLHGIEVLREQLTVLATQVAQWLLHLGASPEAIQYLAPKV